MPWTVARVAGVLAAVTGTLAGCGGSGSPKAATPATTRPATVSPASVSPTAAFTGGQGCLGPGSGRAVIAWSKLHNPIFTSAASSAKDEVVHLFGGRWYLLFSSAAEVPGAASGSPAHWSIGAASSRDLSAFSPLSLWPDQPGTQGLASPDITQLPDGRFVVTYTSYPRETNGEAKIYYRSSADLVTWSAPRPLGPVRMPTERVIDPALAFLPRGVMLGYKIDLPGGRQAFEVAFSPSGSLDGPWTIVGRPNISLYGDTVENYQFLRIDGQWRLTASSNQLDQPWLFALGGPPEDPASWLRWTGGYELNIPDEPWESAPGQTGATHEHANSAYLCDDRPLDGHFYLLFSGTTELTSYGGTGHNSIGIARTTDLIHWEVP
jgi:hypothetical protein